MKHSRIASYVPPSSYSKNSPSSRPQSGTKYIDSSKGSKLAQADMNIRIQPYRSAQETSDKKHSPLSKERKNDLTANLYQVSRALDKDQQTYSKLYKNKETQQRKTQKSTIVSRPADKLTEKLSIYQYVQSKSKKLEDYKSCLNLSNQVSSRASSRIVAHDEQNESLANKACDMNVLPSKRLLGTANDSSQSKSKPKSPLSYQKNMSTTTIRGAQKPSGTNAVKHIELGQGSTNNLSFNEAIPDYSKTPDTKKVGGDNSVNSGDNFNEALANKLKAALQGLQGDLQNARHRRGLSTGQNSIFVEQEIVQEKIKPIELAPAPVVAVDPQQEQDEFFERFFHSDQMTFEFEKLIVSQRNKPQKVSMTAATTPTNQKKPMTAHARTRSIDNQSSPMQTKTSSRWNTKRSSVGEEPQPYLKEAYNLIDKLSQLDRAEGDKDERQRYLRG